MRLYAGVKVPVDPLLQMEIVMISDNKPDVERAVNEANARDGAAMFYVLSTEHMCFSNGFMASISMDYDQTCLEETILSRLEGMGVDCNSSTVRELAGKLAGTANHDILHYDVDEDYAIDEAFRSYEGEVKALV